MNYPIRIRKSATITFLFAIILLFQLPVFAQQKVDTTLHLKAQEGLQFDIIRFSLKPGTKVKLIFTNVDDMDHNMVIVKPGTREKVINDALALGEKGPSLYYVPRTDDVIWATQVLAPHQEAEYYFTVPSIKGIYPFVCTYPGHGLTMYGAIYAGIDMPSLENDPNIPVSRRGKTISSSNSHTHHEAPALHPYTLEPPYLYRVFMPYSGPASIAVRLPGDISYCYDAELCRIRYAWSGGFLSNIDLWKNKKDTCAILQGEIIFRDDNKHPILLDETGNTNLKFKGYRLVDGGYPEFNYELNGIMINELTKPLENKKGLATTYRIHHYRKTIRIPLQETYIITSKQGKIKGSALVIPARKAREFTVITEIK